MTQGDSANPTDTRGTFQPTAIEGVHVFEPVIHGDDRGSFHEWFRADAFIDATGYPFIPEQANMSVSAAGVVRGLHFADVPPGQAKLVTCPVGHIVDIVVDIRRGSPTHGRVVTVELEASARRVVHLPIGVAHGFVSLADGSVLSYLTSSAYDPESEHAVSILDPSLGVDVAGILAGAGLGDPVLSERDRSAPTVGEFASSGSALPEWDDCREFETALRDGWAMANEEAGEP